MQKLMSAVLFAATSVVALSSCTKDPLSDLTEDESRVYITNRDSSVNFSSYKTYSLSDSVSLIDNGRYAGREATSWDVQVTSAIASAMNARGFTRVNRSQNPDLGINVSRVYNTTTNLVDLSGYWNSYGNYYDPYYWGYSGYDYYFPSDYAVYQSTEAALSIDLLDLKNASSNGAIKGIWYGLVRGSGIFKNNNVNEQVTALFTQSPYLQTTR